MPVVFGGTGVFSNQQIEKECLNGIYQLTPLQIYRSRHAAIVTKTTGVFFKKIICDVP